MAVIYPGKFIFLATPHTASSAVDKALRQGPYEKKTYWSVPTKSGFGHHHATLEEALDPIHGGVTAPADDEVIWSIKRNPYDMAATWWVRYKYPKGPQTLPEFLREWNQTPFVVGGRIFWHDAEEWLLYENLPEDLDRLMDRLDLPRIQPVRQNVTKLKKPFRTYWDDESLGIFNERFGEEIVKMGYPLCKRVEDL